MPKPSVPAAKANKDLFELFIWSAKVQFLKKMCNETLICKSKQVTLPSERCQSDRSDRTRNAAYGQLYRGFESRPFRQQNTIRFMPDSVLLQAAPTAALG